MYRSKEVLAVVGIIAATAFVYGPVVGAVELANPEQGFSPDFGHGNATVEIISGPEDVRISKGAFGAGSYYLTVAPTTVELRDVRGIPSLAYEVEVHELNFSRSTVHFVSTRNEGSYELTLSGATFDPDEITRDRYNGTVSITLRSGHDERTVTESNVTIEVVE